MVNTAPGRSRSTPQRQCGYLSRILLYPDWPATDWAIQPSFARRLRSQPPRRYSRSRLFPWRSLQEHQCCRPSQIFLCPDWPATGWAIQPSFVHKHRYQPQTRFPLLHLFPRCSRQRRRFPRHHSRLPHQPHHLCHRYRCPGSAEAMWWEAGLRQAGSAHICRPGHPARRPARRREEVADHNYLTRPSRAG